LDGKSSERVKAVATYETDLAQRHRVTERKRKIRTPRSGERAEKGRSMLRPYRETSRTSQHLALLFVAEGDQWVDGGGAACGFLTAER
jgi:hypothetical protein